VAKGISKERIVSAALDVLDDGGIDAVTLRAVAARLGVQAPALYWHVHSKQDLLDEMGTEIERRVAEATEALVAGEDWLDDLAGYARILRREYLAHRDGARTFSGTLITDPQALRRREPGLARWVDEGVRLEDAVDATGLVTAFVVGFVIEEQERSQSDPDRYDVDRRDAVLGDDVPLVRELGHLRGDSDVRFERQLAMLLAGVSATSGTHEDAGGCDPAGAIRTTPGAAGDRRSREGG
jgi:AcrR family transcriptional regulator